MDQPWLVCGYHVGGPIWEAAKLFLNVMPTFTATELVEFKDLPEGKVWMDGWKQL